MTKRFGGTEVLSDVTLDIAAGSVHALVGENGAGKSTLAKIIGGVYRADGGEVRLNGDSVNFGGPRDALRRGVTTIAQEIALVDELNAERNVLLGFESARGGVISARRSKQRYAALVAKLGFDIPPHDSVGQLRMAERQQVEILRAIARDARVIIMDEPTSALGAEEAAKLHDIIRQLRDDGTTIIYVSHFLDDVLRVADTVSVLRNGRLVTTLAASETSTDALVKAMIGENASVGYPPKRPASPAAPVILRVDNLGRRGAFTDVSFQVRAGEILGIAGLVGSGRSELLRAIFGADPPDTGEIFIAEKSLRPRSPKSAVRAGIAFVPEERRTEGLVMEMSVQANTALVISSRIARFGLLSRRRERRASEPVLKHVALKPMRLSAQPAHFSGGNQQKIVIARCLVSNPKVLLLDEPTRGVDVGARRAIYDLIAELAADGIAIVIVSSDLEEVVGLAHRLLVMRLGRAVASLSPEVNHYTLMRAVFGMEHSDEQ
ncbi:MAG TPA: sugar ABC transporter ATP-binding protein [Solirubrobacteraceae bacterium]